MSNIIKQLEQEQLKQNVPSFRPGDTLEVKVWVVEGSKRRLQAFEGVVIAIRNRGLHSAFTLRKILNPMGEVEAMEFLIDKLMVAKTNDEFFEIMKRS